MKKLEANLDLQIAAIDYLEKTFGKDWRDKNTLNTTTIFNAFISGFQHKERADKTAKKLIYPRKYVDKVEPYRETIEKKFGLEVIVKDDMPENLIALIDDKGNVLTFVEIDIKK